MSGRTKLLVFSDLDGTLLDHESYRFDKARPALEALRTGGHALVLASSKTAAEIVPLRKAMGFEDCEAIVENGAGILAAGSGPGAGRAVHERLIASLNTVPQELRARFSGFSQWSAGEVSQRTGLSVQEAELARSRQYSEPGIWSGTPEGLREFEAALAGKGVTAHRGGRFLTLSFGADKAARMEEVSARYRKFEPELLTVALGDAPNDIAMLRAADLGIIIANAAHEGIPKLAEETDGRIRRSDAEGPAGWNAEILKLLANPPDRKLN